MRNKDKMACMHGARASLYRGISGGAPGGLGQGGFTIVELLVSVLILIFVSVALMQTAIVNIEFNVKNSLRDEGVRIAGEVVDDIRNAGVANVVAIYHGTTGQVTRRIRNIDASYNVSNSVADVGTFGKKVNVFVEWQWKGEMYNTTVSTVR